MQNHINALIEHREIFGVNSEYLFARPGVASVFPFRGCDAIREVAFESGVQKPTYMTSRKLRKQMATLAQLLNLSENSQDLVATFAGHDIRVHRSFYRLPEGTLQIAKVAKLLHCINDGTIGQYKGKSFEEIDFQDTETLNLESDDECEEHEDIECKEIVSDEAGNVRSKTKHIWTNDEKDAISRHFAQQIRQGKVPGKAACMAAAKKEAVLQGLDWKSIKYAVYNHIQKKTKQLKMY